MVTARLTGAWPGISPGAGTVPSNLAGVAPAPSPASTTPAVCFKNSRLSLMNASAGTDHAKAARACQMKSRQTSAKRSANGAALYQPGPTAQESVRQDGEG